MMHACRESREEGGKYYTKCLEREMLSPIPETNTEQLKRNTVFINFNIDRIILQDTGSAFNLTWDSIDLLNLPFQELQELQGAHHLHVYGDNLIYLNKIMQLLPVKKFTILPIRETETEEDMHRGLTPQIRFLGFTDTVRLKSLGLDIEVDHRWVSEELGLSPCAVETVLLVPNIDRMTPA